MLIFLFQVSLSEPALDAFIGKYALIPADIVDGKNLYTLFTSMFMHWSWAHLLWNMVFLWIFWDNIEARIGNVKFVIFYLLAWLAADFLQVVVGPSVTIPNLGASGAISGVLWAYLIMFPGANIKMLYWWGVYYMKAAQFLLYWIAVQFLSWVGSLWWLSEGWVAYFAHIGWFIAGVLWGKMFKNKYGGEDPSDWQWKLIDKKESENDLFWVFWQQNKPSGNNGVTTDLDRLLDQWKRG